MKKFLPAFLLLFTLNGFCQDYIPFLSNTIWNITSADFGGVSDAWIMPGNNVTVGTHTYIQYSDVPMAGDMLVREDVAQRKVYRYLNDTDELLYDFSLNVNDGITMPDGTILTVTQKDSVVVMTGRKRLKISLDGFTATGYPVNDDWIEGVGSWAHPLMHWYELPTDPSTSIRCSYNNNEPAFNLGQVYNGNPVDCTIPDVGTAKVHKYASVMVYPNPFTGLATLSSEIALNNASLIIVNTLGQQVKQINNLYGNEVALNRENLTAGLYFIRLVQGGKVVYTDKVVVND